MYLDLTIYYWSFVVYNHQLEYYCNKTPISLVLVSEITNKVRVSLVNHMLPVVTWKVITELLMCTTYKIVFIIIT